MKKYLLIIPALLLLACNKGDDTGGNTTTPTPQPTKKELLTAKPWKYKSWTISPALKDSAGNPYTDYLGNLAPCMQDDIFTFHTNSNIDTDEGPTKCSSSDPQTKTGSWFFTSNESAINMNGNVFLIAMLATDSMKWTFSDLQGSTTYTHFITFKH